MKQNSNHQKRAWRNLLRSMCLVVGAGTVFSATYTWDGGDTDDNLWGSDDNWNPNAAPTPAVDADLIFAGTARLSPSFNYTDGDDFRDITFDSTAGAFTINPDSGSKGIDWYGSITNDSTALQTLGINLYLQGGTRTINATSGSIKLNGSIYNNGNTLKITGSSSNGVEINYGAVFDGTGGVQIDSGSLKLGGVTFAGTARTYTIASGATLNINGNTGVATGTTTFSGGGTLLVTGGTFGNEGPNSPVGSGRNITMNLGAGAMIDIQSGATMINGGWQNTTWTDNLASMNVNGTFNVWDGQTVIVDALTGSGLITKSQGSSNVDLRVGVNNSNGNFTGTFYAGSNGGWTLVKQGTGTQQLSGTIDYITARARVENGVLLLNMTSSAAVHAIGGGLTVAGGTAKLGGTGGDQIYNGTGVTVNSGTFDMNGLPETVGYLNGSGGTVSNSGGSQSVLTVNLSGTQDYGGAVSGNIKIIKAGAGTQTLSGVGDNNSALAEVSDGTLVLGKTSSGSVHAIGGGLTVTGGTAKLGGTGGDQISDGTGVTVNGGTFDMNGLSETVNYLDGSGGTVSNSGGSQSVLTISIGSLGEKTYSGAINGNVRVAVTNSTTKNSNVAWFNGTNGYTGGTLIDNGHLRVTGDAALGAVPGSFDAANITLQNGGVLQNRDSNVTLDANRGIYLGSGGGVIYSGWAGSRSMTIPGAISGPGSLTKTDGAPLILNGTAANTYSGGTVFREGRLDLAKPDGVNAIPGDISFTGNPNWGGSQMAAGVRLLANEQVADTAILTWSGLSNAADFRLRGFTETIGGLASTAGTNAIVENNGPSDNVPSDGTLVLNVTGSNSYSFNGQVRDQNSGGTSKLNLTKTGTGTQTLAGSSIIYTGTTAVNQGRLIVQNTGTAFDTPSASIAGGAVLEFNAATGNTIQLNNNGQTISGTGTLEKTGPGNLLFGASGQTIHISLGSGALIDVKEGLLRNEYFAGNWAANKADLNIASGATVDVWDANITVDALTGSGTMQKGWAGTHTLTVGVDNGSGVFSGVIQNPSGTLHLTKSGTGSQTLSGANTFTGITSITGGTLLMGANNVLPTTSAVKLDGGTLGTGGYSNTTSGTLDLLSSSVIDFGTSGSGDSVLNFSKLNWTAGTLSVWNWTGAIWASGGTEQLRFSIVNNPVGDFANVQFYSGENSGALGVGGRFVDVGGGFVELVPVPEPSAAGAAALLFGAICLRGRRGAVRRRQGACVPAGAAGKNAMAA
ncbi:MAG: autotransporter-associated beta strand repeat-containing protein [Verrucomicrobiales bacterium]|nr:autotransporter-associated beta strand repeat-containing protein [Verrucomicrobiales bacterium]